MQLACRSHKVIFCSLAKLGGLKTGLRRQNVLGKGVAEVINELQVIDRSSIADHAKDILINKSLQARLLVDQEIKFINYTVDTVNGTVYLFGIAQNQEELERVIAAVRQTNYVENIVNYVTIK